MEVKTTKMVSLESGWRSLKTLKNCCHQTRFSKNAALCSGSTMQTIVGKRNIDEPKQSTIDVSSDCLSSKPKPTTCSIEIETTDNYRIR